MNNQTKPIRDGALSAPDQTETARELIDEALASWNGKPVATALARVIAAASHAGADTALGRFAGCGELDASQALIELRATPRDEMHWLWRGTLAGYLDQQQGSAND